MHHLADTQLAETTLRRILVGATPIGVRFFALQLLFEPTNPVSGEPYVNLSSAWTLYASRPESFPEDESEVPEVEGEDEELALAISLRRKVVSSVDVLSPWPHLVITFSDGTVLYLNGKNDMYEPWTAGLAHTPPGEDLMVIACPGGGLAFMLPKPRL